MTRAGVILGTAAYMSPEQAKGKPVDKRADIFAFGAVLYELLTGKRAFEGETITETIAKVLESEPDWTTLPENSPWGIRTLLRRCLHKEVNQRLQHIGDVRIEIEEAITEPTVLPMGVATTVQPAPWKAAIPWSITLLIAAIAIGTVFWPSSSSRPSVKRLVIPLSPTAPVTNTRGGHLAISPDGTHVVYVSNNRSQLYLRELGDLNAIPLPGTEGAESPFFSPDGNWIAFFASGKLKKVSISGGSPIAVCDVTGPVEFGSWGADDTIVFAAGAGTMSHGLDRVSASGGEAESLSLPDRDQGEFQYDFPRFLPDGSVLFTINREDGNSQIAVLSLETGERKILLDGAAGADYFPSGHLSYSIDGTGTLMAVPFDLQELEITGDAVPVGEEIRSIDYASSDEGTLIYIPSVDSGDSLLDSRGTRNIVFVDREGQAEVLIDEPARFESPRFSPDGQYLAVTRFGDFNVWVYEIARGISTPFTFEGNNVYPIWTPDGKRLTFRSTRTGQQSIVWKPADGTGEAEILTESRNILVPHSWSPDGLLAYSEGLPESGDLWVLPLEGEREPEEFLVTEFNERHSMFSPDGRWIAFTSDRSGRDEIYVMPYPQGGIVPISDDGGREPIWARDGEELIYRNGEKMMVVSVQTDPIFRAETPRLLFEGKYSNITWTSNYDISPDGQHIVIAEVDEGSARTQIHVVLNWFEELKRLAPIN
jgi:serine/threonine-protein kinase